MITLIALDELGVSVFALTEIASQVCTRRRGTCSKITQPPLLAAVSRCTHHVGRSALFAVLSAILSLSVCILHTTALSPSSSLPGSSEAEGTWTSFSAADGLAADSILALDVADSGHLWVGTSGGVSVLAPNGDWLTLAGLEGDPVVDVTPDPASTRRHWFATYGGGVLLDDGGSSLDQTDDSWITFGESDGLVKDYVWTVAVDTDGDVWFGTDHIDGYGNEAGYGVSVLDVNDTPFDKSDDTWTTYTAANSDLSHDVIRDIAVDGGGVIWIATQSGLNAYSGGAWTAFYASDGLASSDVTALLAVGDMVWIGTKGGISVLDYGDTPHSKADDRWATYTQYNSGLADNDTSSLAVDGAGRMWIGTDQKSSGGEAGSGVSVLDANGTPFDRTDDDWTTFTTSSGLAHNAVRTVATVGSSAAWFGTKEGLSHLAYGSSPYNSGDNRWTTYRVSERLAGSSVYAVAQAGSEATWLGTDQGLSLLEYNGTPHLKRDDQWTTFTASDDLADDGIRALAIDDGRVWVGTAAGVTVLDTNGTLADKGDDVSITYDSSNSDLEHDQVNAIVMDGAGRAWIGCGSYFGGGLHVLDVGGSLGSRGDDTWATFTSLDSGLPNSYVEAVALGAGNDVWLGTHGGAAQLNHAGSPFDDSDDNWTVFTTGDSGLAFDTVRDIAVDQAGNVWFGLLIEGVSVYSSDGDWLTFTQSDGLAYNSVYAVAVDRAGDLWLGTDGGGASVLDYAGTLMDKSDDTWTTYEGGEALLSGHIRAITPDGWGQVWLGTFGGGASVRAPLRMRIYLPVVTRNVR